MNRQKLSIFQKQKVDHFGIYFYPTKNFFKFIYLKQQQQAKMHTTPHNTRHTANADRFEMRSSQASLSKLNHLKIKKSV